MLAKKGPWSLSNTREMHMYFCVHNCAAFLSRRMLVSVAHVDTLGNGLDRHTGGATFT